MTALKISPAFKSKNIPVFFACDNNFAGYLSVALLSLLEHSSQENNYDIVIIENNMEKFVKKALLKISPPRCNVSIRFFSVTKLAQMSNAQEWKVPHFLSPASFYRLFIPIVAQSYSKVIYLDCDTLVCSDIAKLYNINIENNYLAAVIDPNSEIRDIAKLSDHLCNDLGYKDRKLLNYVNTGVLVFNTSMLHQKKICEDFFHLAKLNKGFFGDQDVLNVACEDNIFFLDPLWNVFWGLSFERYKMRDYSDNQVGYLLDHAYITHYAGEKPTQRPNESAGLSWWAWARKTPFYEDFLMKSMLYKLKNVFQESYYSSMQRTLNQQ